MSRSCTCNELAETIIVHIPFRLVKHRGAKGNPVA